jgi:hypothetical protein
MTIQVVSTTDTQAAPAAGAPVAETASMPVADKAAEQKESPESDTEENETAAEAKDTPEAEDDSDEDSTEANDDAKDKPKKKSGSQRRKERAERAEAEVARLQRLVEDMALKGAGGQKPEPVETPKAANPADDAEPIPDDFETHQEYVRALTKWTVNQSDKEKEQKAAKAKLEAEQSQRLNAHYERVNAFAEKTADYEEVIESVGDMSLSVSIQDLLIASENGPELLYELAKNRTEFERINKLGPLAAAREIGRFEARFIKASEDPKPEPKKTTQAPKPIAPVGGKSGKVEKSIYDATLSQREYEALRDKQTRKATG